MNDIYQSTFTWIYSEILNEENDSWEETVRRRQTIGQLKYMIFINRNVRCVRKSVTDTMKFALGLDTFANKLLEMKGELK